MTKPQLLALMAGLLMTACGATTPKDCNASTCQGCCTADGKCEAGNTSNACGSIGGMCRDCSGLGLTCTLGACSTLTTGSGGGASSGGGTGGGTTGETSIVTDSTYAPHISFPLPASSFGNLGYAVKR